MSNDNKWNLNLASLPLTPNSEIFVGWEHRPPMAVGLLACMCSLQWINENISDNLIINQDCLNLAHSFNLVNYKTKPSNG